MAAGQNAGARNFDMQIKLMMIGDTTVGKTSLLLRFADDDFNESVLATIGIDFKIKVLLQLHFAWAKAQHSAQSRSYSVCPSPLISVRHDLPKSSSARADHGDRWAPREAANLGHGRPGEIPIPRSDVLPGCWCGHCGLLCHELCLLHPGKALDRTPERPERHGHLTGWEQMRPRGGEVSSSPDRERVRLIEWSPLCGDFCQDSGRGAHSLPTGRRGTRRKGHA
mmetsp:Transcript_2879/g.8292  ORF Transcript_2879/g.8292 Transcript_2879/m.8292 type:complete len:224 (-) Transcript_2879:240-911(-)